MDGWTDSTLCTKNYVDHTSFFNNEYIWFGILHRLHKRYTLIDLGPLFSFWKLRQATLS